MIIDIYQDTICPWCRIGKKNLFDAIAQWQGEPITVRYRSFILDPHAPKEGYPFREAMAKIAGGPDGVDRILEHVTQAGERVGVPFRFDRVEFKPNTLLSHNLIKVTPEAQQTQMVDAIYRAYFEDGQDIGNLDVLVTIAREQGFDPETVRVQVANEAKQKEIEADLHLARELQITGVPFFVIDEKLALSGAHPVENFLKAFEQAALTEQA
ncbi:DsbA family oxidoreductase [Brevibacillus fluminis]|uniref:DsbA family oxidoreductase n=1 Tax=Brevibacillus fluminis TaxID=511487 RepID=UPI003F8C31D6